MNAILVLNSGSSSIKFGVFPAQQESDSHLIAGQIDGIGSTPRLRVKTADGSDHREDLSAGSAAPFDHDQALATLLEWVETNARDIEITAAGHRVVHGGSSHAAPVRVDDAVLTELEALVPLAPLHQPHNIKGIRALASRLPEVSQVACFDTAFHATQPPEASHFALPRALTDDGIRRYGFHGLSYDYVTRQLPEVIGSRARGAVVIAHLGAGASLCALREGQSVATTMGFTAIDGLMMATRPGTIDPGVMLYLMEDRGMNVEALTRLLYHESGLLGVSGISADMRELLASDTPAASEAIDLFCYRVSRELGSMMAAAGGLDALVFTAGIGEHSKEIRERIAALASWTGLRIDPALNAAGALRIDAPDSTVAVAVIPTNEEAMIARYTREMLAGN